MSNAPKSEIDPEVRVTKNVLLASAAAGTAIGGSLNAIARIVFVGRALMGSPPWLDVLLIVALCACFGMMLIGLTGNRLATLFQTIKPIGGMVVGVATIIIGWFLGGFTWYAFQYLTWWLVYHG
jgi:hypothetical protein